MLIEKKYLQFLSKFVLVDMSQVIEEIRHFQKSLGISGNASAIVEICNLFKNT